MLAIEEKIKLVQQRLPAALMALEKCRVCPRHCGINRLDNVKGPCGAGRKANIARVRKHFGEEPCLVGEGGSGTIFFSGCNLSCIFCQNHPISRPHRSFAFYSDEELALAMLGLQQDGAENLNLVTPSHYVPQIMEALLIAWQRGLVLPIVWNSGGYDEPEMLELLDGFVDIYMPDAKYDDPEIAAVLSGRKDYVAVNRAALRIMHDQVGDLLLDEKEVAQRGLLVRHLVLPKNLAGTEGVMRFLASLSTDTIVSLMSQYFPNDEQELPPMLQRVITAEEYEVAKKAFFAAGLSRGFMQELGNDGEEFGIEAILRNDDKEEGK